MKTKNQLFLLALILGIKSLIILGIILYGGIGLGPDEAQYWTWSQSLAWGYYSKPPGVAWQIALGTSLFGNTELGVRFISILLGALTSLAVFRLGYLASPRSIVPLLGALIFTLSPLGWLGSFLAITDGGLILFWTLACCPIAASLARHEKPNYLAVGVFVLCGALFKWPIYFLWVLVILLLPFFDILRDRTLIAGAAISSLGLAPSLVWNIENHWATFRHVGATIGGGSKQAAQGNFFEFLGSQAALLSPLLFALLLFAWWRIRRSSNLALLFCGLSSLAILTGFSFASIFYKIQGNWCAFYFPTAAIFLAWHLEHMRKGKVWSAAALSLSAILTLAAFSIPYLQANRIFHIPYAMNPFRHNVGWKALEKELEAAGFNPDRQFLFGDKYQISSILSFYNRSQQRAYFLNLQDLRRNQFSYWHGMEKECLEKSGFFIFADNIKNNEAELQEKSDLYKSQLSPYFSRVEYLGLKPLFFSNGKLAKAALLYRCENYNGKIPGTGNYW